MIKKLLIIISTMLFSFVASAQDIEVKPGDIALWVPAEGFEKLIADIRCPELTFYYHSDVVYDDNGGVVTSAPPEGCGAISSIENRIESGKWLKLAILRNENLAESEIESVLETAFSLECDYDWIGLYLQLSDFIWTCSDVEFFRLFLPPDWPFYNCLSFAAYCHGFPYPHRITPWGMMVTPGWEIVGEYNLEE